MLLKNKKIGFTIFVIFAFISFGVFSFSRLSDIRPKEVTYPNNVKKAKKLLTLMGKAHDIAAWDSIERYQAYLSDEFYGIVGKVANPFAKGNSNLKLLAIPGIPGGTLNYQSDGQQSIWSLENGKTFLIGKDGKKQLKETKTCVSGYPPTNILRNCRCEFKKQQL